MEILIIAGAAALIGAYASSRNSRDRELARLERKARHDAKAAFKKGDSQACFYYQQVARDFAVQRLQEAEQRAVNEAYKLDVQGKKTKADKARRKADEIRQRLNAEFHVQSQRQQSLPTAQPQAAAGADGAAELPPIQPYAPYTPNLHAAHVQQAQLQQTLGQAGPILYTAFNPSPSSSSSAPSSFHPPPPPASVRYYNSPHADVYPSIPPPAYTPPAVPTISSAPTLLSEPFATPVKHK